MSAKKGPKEWSPFDYVRDARVEQCLVILAPGWFVRKDFRKWRLRSGVATWRDPSPEGQDVFIVFADGELDWHTEGMPEDILSKLAETVEEAKMDYGVIWIKAV